MDDKAKEYTDYIAKEVERKRIEKYTGNLKYKINFKQGGIVNINKGIEESIKL